GSSRFPVLVPAGLALQRSELEPDVVQIELAEVEQRRLVSGVGAQRRARQVLSALDLREKICDERGAGGTGPERVLLLRSILDERLDLKQQRRAAQLADRRIVS